MLRISTALGIAVFVVASCMPDNTIHKCLDVAKHPEKYREFGRCSVRGELVKWKDDYIFRADNADHFVFVGDIEYVWSEAFSDYVGHQIEISGRYQILADRYPSIIEVETIFPPVEMLQDKSE
ncbi:MAG: hypothetical protein AAFP91_12415 [Pseudomonadota bacterium]